MFQNRPPLGHQYLPVLTELTEFRETMRKSVAEGLSRAFAAHLGASRIERIAGRCPLVVCVLILFLCSLHSSLSAKPIIVIAGDQVANVRGLIRMIIGVIAYR